jgi:SAM-dependent methyltransferase
VGKTTAGEVTSQVIDPSPVPRRKPPKDSEGWITAASGSWTVMLDNLSHIPPWFSDTLCRAATGEGDVRRRLYSDSDLQVFSFRRCVVITGISLGALQGDLGRRLILVDMEPMAEGEFREEPAMKAAFAAAHPRLLGALFDVAAKVLAVLPDTPPVGETSMASFARILKAFDTVTGEHTLDTYLAQSSGIQERVVEDDPFASALVSFVTERKTWTGTAGALATELEPDDAKKALKDWPKTGVAVSGALRRVGASLRTVNVDVRYNPSARPRTWTLTKVEPPKKGPPPQRDTTRDSPGTTYGTDNLTEGASVQGKRDVSSPSPSRRLRKSDMQLTLQNPRSVSSVSSVSSSATVSCGDDLHHDDPEGFPDAEVVVPDCVVAGAATLTPSRDDEAPGRLFAEPAGTTTIPPHPAEYSPELYEHFIELLKGYKKVLDPFAGTGGTHGLAAWGHDIVGVEIEERWAAAHPSTIHGDATEVLPTFQDGAFDAICTSPVYGNGLGDYAKIAEETIDYDDLRKNRVTYRGHYGAPLHPNNAARFRWHRGTEEETRQYEALHERVWREAARVLRPGGRFLLNIKDFPCKGERARVTDWHRGVLLSLGLRLVEERQVETSHMKRGANTDVRYPETILVFEKPEDSAPLDGRASAWLCFECGAPTLSPNGMCQKCRE